MLLPCAHGSHAAKCPPGENREQDDKGEEDTLFAEEKQTLWLMSGDFTYRHHEVR